MKKLHVLLAAVLVLELVGCRSASKKSNNQVADQHMTSPALAAPVKTDPAAAITVGESSTTVERLGKKQGCETTQGASLLTTDGPIQTYRMQCTDGSVFMARCEYRQCVRMQ